MKYFYLSFLLISFGCEKLPGVSDVPLTPASSQYSKSNKLLINTYSLPKDHVKILGNNYIICDAWTSYNFKSKSDKRINKESRAFYCTFLNINTNEKFINFTENNVNNFDWKKRSN